MFLATLASKQVAPLVVFFSAVIVYANTIPAGFTFDDNFAVVNNKDVTDVNNPVWTLLLHDFWGQDITSDSSHKSYRPVTVLSFRVIRQLWYLLSPGFQVLSLGEACPFHLVNILLHGVVSMLVYRLAYHLFTCKELPSILVAWCGPHNVSAQCTGGESEDSSSNTKYDVLDAVPEHVQHSVQVQSLVCGLAFALHPAHTEAVAGIVGHAELLCGYFGIQALLTYFEAADGRYLTASMFPVLSASAQAQARGVGDNWGSSAYWKLVLSAMGLAWLSAFSKEVGITMVGCMMVYELLDLGRPIRHMHLSLVYPKGAGTPGSVAIPKNLRSCLLRRKALRLVLCTCAAVAYVKVRSWVAGDHLVRIYREVENPIPFCEDFWTRFWTSGWLHTRYFGLLLFPLQLSADWSYKCLPLVEDVLDWRNSLTGLLYAYLVYCFLAAKVWDVALVSLGFWPAQQHAGPVPTPTLSTPPASSGRSSRHPVQVAAAAAAAASHCELPGAGVPEPLMYARWTLGVLVGLLVAPFFPASNVLFYVGTVIGERLLYLPSVGYCILLADLVYQATRSRVLPLASPESADQPSKPITKGGAPPSAADATPSSCKPQPANNGGTLQSGADSDAASDEEDSTRKGGEGWLTSMWCLLVCALASMLLGWYFVRTFTRNWDWQSEEALFLSALQVCPESAKVQLNNGILQRRFHNMDAALRHFERARTLVPSYCEPDYWIGITLLNSGKMDEALVELQSAISCKYVAVESVMALNTIFKVLREANPRDVSPMLRWGQILLHPDLERIADACVVLEEAALIMAADHRNLTGAYAATQYCLEALKSRVGQGGQEPETLREKLAAIQARSFDKPAAPLPPSDADLRHLWECVKARSIVYGAVAKHGLLSKSVKRHMYRYLHTLAPTCRTSSLGPTLHTQLVNRLQSADAYDPWLHMEWAEVLASNNPPRIAEGATHLQAAAALLLSVPLKPRNEAAPAYRPVPGAPSYILALDGEGPVAGLAAVEASILVLKRAMEMAAGVIDTCQILSNLCEANLQLMQLSTVGSAAYSNAQVQAGMCIQDLFSQPNCQAQRAHFTQQRLQQESLH